MTINIYFTYLNHACRNKTPSNFAQPMNLQLDKFCKL